MAITTSRQPLDIDEIIKAYNALADEIYKDLDKQYCDGKINGPKYADTWAALQQAAISGAFSAVVSLQTKETEADRCLKEAQCGLTNAQKDEIIKESLRKDDLTAQEISIKKVQEGEILKESLRKDDITAQEISTKKAQENVLIRQEAGFDDNLRQKLFEAQMNAWALMFSSGLLEKMPCFIDSDEATMLYDGILKKKMPNYTPPPTRNCGTATTTAVV